MFSEKCAKKYHVKKGQTVEVISGEWKKETGKIVAVLKKKDRVVPEYMNEPALIAELFIRCVEDGHAVIRLSFSLTFQKSDLG